MNPKLIIVVDLGSLRAYREVQELGDREARLERIMEFQPEAAHQKLSEQLTDQAGRFPRGAGTASVPGDLSAGERLSLEAEQTRRLITQLAEKISALVTEEEASAYFLAVSAPFTNNSSRHWPRKSAQKYPACWRRTSRKLTPVTCRSISRKRHPEETTSGRASRPFSHLQTRYADRQR